MRDVQSRVRYWLVVLTAFVLLFSLPLALLLGADLWAHHRLDPHAALNIWGYRGDTVGSKRPGEIRVACLGGSTTFGYGTPPAEAFPAQLQNKLNQATSDNPYTVINLGMNMAGAYSLVGTLEDYQDMEFDLAVLYTGYNDVSPTELNYHLARRGSPLFRLVGYYPVLPIALREKSMLLRFGNVEAGYRGTKTVFRPGVVAATSASLMDSAANISDQLQNQLDRFDAVNVEKQLADKGKPCGQWWFYCQSVDAAIETAVKQNTRVLVVTQPNLGPLHLSQQTALREFLTAKWGDNPLYSYANLFDAVDVKKYGLDGMHLGPEGNALVAEALVDPVREALR